MLADGRVADDDKKILKKVNVAGAARPLVDLGQHDFDVYMTIFVMITAIVLPLSAPFAFFV